MLKRIICRAFGNQLRGLDSGVTFRLDSIPFPFRVLRAIGKVSIDHIGPNRWAIRKA